MMKAVIILLVLGGLALLAIYYFGGIKSFDPTKIGNECKAAMTPGMPWTKVVEIAPRPRAHYRIVYESKKTPFGKVPELRMLKGPYDYEMVRKNIADGLVPDGFVLEYFFSSQVAFQVWFDPTGLVDHVQDILTMADLLDTRDKGP